MSNRPALKSAVPGGAAHGATEIEVPPAMAEIELLPQWYPALVRRRRLLLLQVWSSAAVLLVLVAVLVWRQANVEAKHMELASLGELRREADATLADHSAEQARLDRLLAQAELVSRVGLPVEVTRLLSAIDAAAPADVALTAVEVVTDQSGADDASPPAAGARRGSGPKSRRMNVVLAGLAARSESVSQLSRSLQRQSLLGNVKVAGQKDVTVYGRQALAFEVTFSVDLSAAGSPDAKKGAF